MSMTITVQQYSTHHKSDWDNFVQSSKNATFMLQRGYMDYHADRFNDISLMFYEDTTLIAVMPCSYNENLASSHAGLSFGGILTNKKMTTAKMLACFESMKSFFKEKNIHKLIYKCIPSIYHAYPSDEDLYALFINEANLIRRDVATVVYLPEKIKFSKGKRWGISKAKQANVEVKQFNDFQLFIECENQILEQKYNTKATHSADEIKRLAESFPDNIKMFGGFINNELMAGTIIYETPLVAHTQYITTTPQGRDVMALELVMDYLINHHYVNKKYFSFGISTENNGTILNNGLIAQKEMYGGRAITHDFYELLI